MITKLRNHLRNDAGVADVFVIGMCLLIMLMGLGFIIVNFAFQSAQAATTNQLVNAVISRAQTYASDLNKSVDNPTAAPYSNTAQDCVSVPGVCTTVLPPVQQTGSTITLKIRADSADARTSILRSIVLNGTTATHVASLDAKGNPIWVNSNDPNPFTIWGVAAASVKTITPAQQTGPTAGTSWISTTTHSGVDSAGNIWVWGPNNACQAGTGASGATITSPVKLTVAATFTKIVSTPTDTIAIDNQGFAWGWGANTNGTLGLGDSAQQCAPKRMFGHYWTDIATANGTTFGLDDDGDLWAWGLDTGGQAGDNGSANIVTPKQIGTSAAQGFIDVATSGNTTYAVERGGQLWTWGANGSGQLGVSGGTTKFAAAQPSITTKFVKVAAGAATGYGIDVAGNIWAWGANASGQVGNNSTANVTAPVRITTGVVYLSVSAGANTAFAYDASGHLRAWGANGSGQLGTGGTTPANVLTPTAILPNSQFRSVDASVGTTVTDLVDMQGAVWSIGSNTGLWPSGATTATGVPLRMPAPSGFANPTWQ